MNDFNFYQPTKVHFGLGRLRELGGIASKYGSKALLVTTDGQEAALHPLYEKVKKILGDSGLRVFHFDGVVPNPTIASIEEALEIVRENEVDVIVPVGGGSSIDTAKAVALFHKKYDIDWGDIFPNYTDPFKEYDIFDEEPLPIISVTTTSGTGAQLTQAMIISDPENNEKNCIFHDRVFSRETIIDPELMLSLPPGLTAVTGFDAFSHSFESYLNENASPYTESLAFQSMEIIIDSLPKLLKTPSNIELRSRMAYADMLSGISLTNAAAGIPHPLSEIIGGVVTKIPHGQCLAVVYPEYIEFMYDKEARKCAEIAKLLNNKLAELSETEAAACLKEEMNNFLEAVGLNNSLTGLGCTEEDLALMEKSFILDVLPWAGRDALFSMIKNSF